MLQKKRLPSARRICSDQKRDGVGEAPLERERPDIARRSTLKKERCLVRAGGKG